MSKHNLQSVLFTLIILGFVFFGRSNKSEFNNSIIGNKISFTSIGSLRSVVISSGLIKNSFIPPENLKAKTILVKNLNNGYTLYSLNDDWRWPIASLTKLMTAVVALEKMDPSQKIFFNDKIIETEGVSGGFKVGDFFSVNDLIRALVGVSSNDAAVALAESYGSTSSPQSGYQNFIDAMQIKASELGMKQTTFFDPTGLSFLNQSTVPDLEKLVRYILDKHPQIFEISKHPNIEISGRVLKNINEFAGEENFLGGKTGFTDDANGNLISLFKNPDGGVLLIIVMGTDDRFGETRKLLSLVQ